MIADISALCEEYRIAGLALGVTNGISINTCFHGHSDLKRRIPVSAATLFRSASLTKPITAAVCLSAALQGTCDLDEDVGAYLEFPLRNPYFPDTAITLRHLLAHVSGLSDRGNYDEFLFKSYSETPPPLKSYFLNTGSDAINDTWHDNKPGEKFCYSNLGYGIAATAVEKISGSHFSDLCHTMIIDPLLMDACVSIEEVEDLDTCAVLYRIDGLSGFLMPCFDNYNDSKPVRRNLGEIRPGYNATAYAPHGGLRATAEAMCRFLGMIMGHGPDISGPGSLRDLSKQMRTIQYEGKSVMGDDRIYGMGLEFTDKLIDGKILIGHRGEAYGFLGCMFADIESNRGIVIMANGGDYYKGSSRTPPFSPLEKRLYNLIYRTIDIV
jgi:CubicO group peptidase (beta-lactamase class C family)